MPRRSQTCRAGTRAKPPRASASHATRRPRAQAALLLDVQLGSMKGVMWLVRGSYFVFLQPLQKHVFLQPLHTQNSRLPMWRGGGGVHDQRGGAGTLQAPGSASRFDVLQDIVRQMGMDDMVVACLASMLQGRRPADEKEMPMDAATIATYSESGDMQTALENGLACAFSRAFETQLRFLQRHGGVPGPPPAAAGHLQQQGDPAQLSAQFAAVPSEGGYLQAVQVEASGGPGPASKRMQTYASLLGCPAPESHRESSLKAKKRRREELTRLLASLNSLIPAHLQRVAQKNGAGRRAVGVGGRSLHDVLHSAVEHVRHITAAEGRVKKNVARGCMHSPSSDASDAPSGRDTQRDCVSASDLDTVMREALLSSASLKCIEVDLRRHSSRKYLCKVVKLGRGTQELIGDVPWGAEMLMGSDFVDMLHPADVVVFLELVAEALSSLQGPSDEPSTGGPMLEPASGRASSKPVLVRIVRFFRHRFAQGRHLPPCHPAAADLCAEAADASDGGALGQGHPLGSVFQELDHDPLLQFTTASSASEASARRSSITVCQYQRVRMQLAVGDHSGRARARGGGECKAEESAELGEAPHQQASVRAVLFMLEEPQGDDGTEACMPAARTEDAAAYAVAAAACGNVMHASSSGAAAASRACSSIPSAFPSAATTLAQDAGRARNVERGRGGACGAGETVAGVEEISELMWRVNGIYAIDSLNSTTSPGAIRKAWGAEFLSHRLKEEMSFVQRIAGRVSSWCVPSLTTALYNHLQVHVELSMDDDNVPRVCTHMRLSFTNMFATPWKKTSDHRLDGKHPIAFENTAKQGTPLWLCWGLKKSASEISIHRFLVGEVQDEASSSQRDDTIDTTPTSPTSAARRSTAGRHCAEIKFSEIQEARARVTLTSYHPDLGGQYFLSCSKLAECDKALLRYSGSAQEESDPEPQSNQAWVF